MFNAKRKMTAFAPAPRRYALCMFYLMLIALGVCAGPQAPRAWGSADYISANTLAAKYGLQYRDTSSGALHSCELAGNGRRATLVENLRNSVIGGATVQLSRPVRWDGRSITVPAEAEGLIQAHFGLSAVASTSVAPPPKPVPRNPPTIRPTPTATRRKRTFTVVIDAGHGGKDWGAHRGSLKEKVINLSVSKKVVARLKHYGVKVVATRTQDVFVDLDDRVAIANLHRPNLFVSIHANTEPTNSLRSSMTFYPDDGVKNRPGIFGRAKSAARRRLLSLSAIGAGGSVSSNALLAITTTTFEGYRAESIKVATIMQNNLAPVTGRYRKKNGVIEDTRGLRVLRGVRAPTVLVEMDFMSHPVSRKKLATESYRTELAKAITKGIMEYLRSVEAGS